MDEGGTLCARAGGDVLSELDLVLLIIIESSNRRIPVRSGINFELVYVFSRSRLCVIFPFFSNRI